MSLGAEVDALRDRISQILAGEEPELQGAVINELAAIWIAGHRVGPHPHRSHRSLLGPGGHRAEGARLREELLRLHTEHVRELIELYLDEVDG